MPASATSARVSARTGMIWLAGLMLAAFSGMAATGSVSSARLPLAVVGVVPESGRVYADAADAVLKQAIRDNGGALPDTIPAASVDYANRAFAIEPLAVQAPRIIALSRASEGRQEDARRIMRLLPPLSKREAVANVWLSQDYARLGEDAKAFEYFDMTLRVSEGSAPLIIPPLVAGLEQEELREPLARLLRARPAWETDFWLEAVRRPEIAEPAMRLRMELGRQQGEALAVDRGLIRNLVDEGRFADAQAYFRFLTGKPAAPDLDFPFERTPAFPPLDWELLTDGDFSSAIEPPASRMLISAAPASRGVVARRLVMLEPGSYRTSVSYTANASEDVAVALTLRCAEARLPPVRSAPFAAAEAQSQLLSFGGQCRNYLLEIDYRNDAPVDGVDIAIDGITLRKEN